MLFFDILNIMSTKPTISFNALSILFNMREIKEFLSADDRFLGWAFSNKNKNYKINNLCILNILINIKKYLEDAVGLEDYYADAEDELEVDLKDDEIESKEISDLKNKYMDLYGEI